MKIFQILSLMSLVSAIYFLSITIIIHFLTKKLSFSKNWLSEYVHIKYGISLKIGFILVSFTEIFLSFLLFNIFENTLLASIFLFISGIGAFIVGIFDSEREKKWAIKDLPHSIGVILQFTAFPISCFFYFLTLSNESLRIISLIFGIIITILGICVIITYFSKKRRHIGIYQKIDILFINTWLIIASIISVNYFF